MRFPKPLSRAAVKKAENRDTEREWQKVRRLVLVRDGWKCRRCKSGDRIEVHHMTPRSLGREDSTRNCLVLCAVCHADRHAYRLVIHGADANNGIRFEVVR